ncbi:nitroreductase family deazaflavin-dependent oxidoreductase [Amycolatopsis pigmentata]|uniref:Nitroreductase family deazaflavin-dependent oxidoreductase n=1 Tax=Amycolatopsis pigmentata TaxID=450801 RepID=A0ABW5G8U8_9PSEU
MVLPKRLARFNRVATNRVLGKLTPHVAGFGTIVHQGRRSGRTYHTPVNVFEEPGGYVVALTYGAGADWVRNVLAEGGCELVTRGRTVKLTAPRVTHGESPKAVSAAARPVLRLIGVRNYLHLRRA